jgi:hypothetical protein
MMRFTTPGFRHVRRVTAQSRGNVQQYREHYRGARLEPYFERREPHV